MLIDRLRECQSLKILAIQGAHVTDSNLVQLLANSPELEVLQLFDTQVTGDGISLVSAARDLRILGVDYLSNHAWDGLSQCQSLQAIKILETSLDTQQCADLFEAVPQLEMLFLLHADLEDVEGDGIEHDIGEVFTTVSRESD